MCETWLQPNRRAVLFGMLLPGIAGLLGLAIAVGWLGPTRFTIWRIGGALVLSVAGLVLLGLCGQLYRPRVSHDNGQIMFNLRGGSPIRVPIEVVEAFLLGQGPTMMSGRQNDRQITRTVVVRLAESATDWARIDVNPRLASWCDGYITIRGTWCEPLNIQVVNRLNRLLSTAKKTNSPSY